MGRHDVAYFRCDCCGLLFTEEPFWWEETFPPDLLGRDTQVFERNILYSYHVNKILSQSFKKGTDSNFLDYGGGLGIFVRLMRDLGWNFLWHDKYSRNLFAGGFEHREQLLTAVTCFEVLEHLHNPMEIIEALAQKADCLIFSTELYSDGFEVRPFESWRYYIPESGQHITFFSKKTFEWLAKKLNRIYYSLPDNIHVLISEASPIKIKKSSKLMESLKRIWYQRKNQRRSLAMSDAAAQYEKRD